VPEELGQAGRSLASNGADARTGQLNYVDCACKITEVRGGETGQARFGMETESRSAEMRRELEAPSGFDPSARQLAHRSLRVQSGIGGAVRI
jgi:hypothetical protein